VSPIGYHPMKTKASLLPKIAFALATLAVLSAAPRASAVPVTFSGGSGSPLTFSLATPVSYTITTGTGAGPVFVFQNVGLSSTFFSNISGSMTFSINGGLAQTLFNTGPNVAAGSVTASDLVFYGSFGALNVGDVILLSAGTWTSGLNFSPAAPANGSYNTFVADATYTRISGNGTSGFVPAPENLSTLWLALPLVGMFAARRRWHRLAG
jgi:hypothetical protein